MVRQALGRPTRLHARHPRSRDFNLPRAEAGDPIYEELTRRGLQLPEHQTKVGTTIAGYSHYDQVAYVPEHTGRDLTGRGGVFDFDGALFRELRRLRRLHPLGDQRPPAAVGRARTLTVTALTATPAWGVPIQHAVTASARSRLQVGYARGQPHMGGDNE